jgi:hypothetical protein
MIASVSPTDRTPGPTDPAELPVWRFVFVDPNHQITHVVSLDRDGAELGTQNFTCNPHCATVAWQPTLTPTAAADAIRARGADLGRLQAMVLQSNPRDSHPTYIFFSDEAAWQVDSVSGDVSRFDAASADRAFPWPAGSTPTR